MNRKRILSALLIACLVIGFGGMPVQASEKIGVSFDNELNSRTPDAVKSSFPYVSVGVSKTYGDEKMRFIGIVDISSLDSSREIKSAVFKIDRASDSWDKDADYSLYEVTESWDTATVTWNNQPLISARRLLAGVSENGLLVFDTTDLVKYWINYPVGNHGFLIMKTEEASIAENNYGLFASADYPTEGAEIRPYIEIVYTDELQPISDLVARAKLTKVQLVWTSVTEAASYDIYRKDPGMPDFLPIAISHVTSYATYLDESPKEPGVYAYMVRWTSESGVSPDSNIATAIVTSARGGAGDVNEDGIVCRTDLSILLAVLNKPASECPKCDLDGDGIITVLDARKLVLMCTNPRCMC